MMVEVHSKEEVKGFLDVLKKMRIAVQKEDVDELSYWSDYLIHSASINGKVAMYIAIISYSLSMILQKQKVSSIKDEVMLRFVSDIVDMLSDTIEKLELGREAGFEDDLTVLMKRIFKFDSTFSRYALDVLEFSKIQKGAKIYQHGLSLSNIADLLGISKWELMHKVGEMKMKYYPQTEKSPKQRLAQLRKIVRGD